MKKCSKCKIEKEFSEFYKNKYRKYGLDCRCKDCRKELSKKYQQANKEKQSEYIKKYYQANKEKIDEHNKKYYEANKEKIDASNRKRYKYKRKNDPLYKFKGNLRSRTTAAFRNMGYSKTSKTQEMLGVNWEIVKQHIERQFTKGMNWDNQGSWHIDHIIPLASANTEKELLKLCHYSNLQPLWAEENLSKKDKIVECQVKLRI